MPGPSPLYRPKFSRLQLAEARELVRKRRVPHALVQRAQLVCLWPKSPRSRTSRPDDGWGFTRTRSAIGGIDGPPKDLFSRTVLGRDVRPSFPPQEIVAIKAIACELPATHNRPLSRLFIPDIVEIAVEEGVVDQISPAMVWRVLDANATSLSHGAVRIASARWLSAGLPAAFTRRGASGADKRPRPRRLLDAIPSALRKRRTQARAAPLNSLPIACQ